MLGMTEPLLACPKCSDVDFFLSQSQNHVGKSHVRAPAHSTLISILLVKSTFMCKLNKYNPALEEKIICVQVN